MYSPFPGEPLKEYTITCANWKDEGMADSPPPPTGGDSPGLSYTYRLKGEDLGCTDSTCKKYLPQGDESNNFIVPIEVSIKDIFGSATQSNVQAKVS